MSSRKEAHRMATRRDREGGGEGEGDESRGGGGGDGGDETAGTRGQREDEK